MSWINWIGSKFDFEADWKALVPDFPVLTKKEQDARRDEVINFPRDFYQSQQGLVSRISSFVREILLK